MSTSDPHTGESLWSIFRRTVARVPDAPAITSSDGSLAFRQVEELASQLAELLAERGVAAGAVVHQALPNTPLFLPAFLALRKLDATVGLVSSRYRDAELRAVTHRLPPTAYLTTPQIAGVLARAIDVEKSEPLPGVGGQPGLSLVFPVAGKPARDTKGLALIKFTSGSTGAPKGVGLTEANLLAEAHNVVTTLAITEKDRIVVPVPVSHSYGFDLGLLPVVYAGARTVLRRSFIPREVLADLADPATSIFLGVPSMYRILAETQVAEVPDLSHVRYLLSCTAPLLPDLVQLCHERLRVPVCQHYGSSETGAAANHRPDQVLARPASVGVACAGVEIRIVGDDGAPLPPGQEGEIVIRSAAVAPGYVTDEGLAAAAFVRVDDRLTEYRTGDIGVLDEDGFLFWRGRKDQVINVGGLKVYPAEVTQVLERCPGVSAARVFAALDPRGEQVVHAVVTLSQSIREQDILAFCRQHLADYKVPRRIEIAEAITSPEAVKMSDLSGET
jgi:long-chain acyl-CoA synthetase